MSQTPFEQAGSLRIGTVDFVSPDKIEVLLDIEAPDSVALNVGAPRAFPRVNSYLLVSVDDGFLTGQVEWITVERSAFPKRRGMRDFGLIDLPYPLRKLRLNPLGMLRQDTKDGFVFTRGADALPSVGESVLLPTEKQLQSIVESGENRRVKIGVSPIAGDADVHIDPNRLFGRHLAVLGNTGSGKSCSVAGLIRWSIEEASKRAQDKNIPNTRFIVLDPNGEYSKAFDSQDSTIKARVFKLNLSKDESTLKVPLWFWNSAEWFAFTQASARTQRPVLTEALRLVRDGHTEPSLNPSHDMRRFLHTILVTARAEYSNGSPWGTFPKPKSFFEKIAKWKIGLESDRSIFTNDQHKKLEILIDGIANLCEARREKHADYDFIRQEVKVLITQISNAHASFGGTRPDITSSDIDAPLQFNGASLLRSVEAAGEMLNVSEYVETLMVRIRALLNDTRMQPIIDSSTDGIDLDQWLKDYIGDNNAKNGCISVIDLSLVPTDVIHIITAVIARMVFEAHQRYMKLKALPTVLVMEEAHTFIKRYRNTIEDIDAAMVCCQVFERIAREGRKFGLGLVLSSQRPSELSPAVLSQCNTFLLHRISNDRDQDIINRLVPDNLRGLLRELPSLPSQSAILLGWASELPILVKMKTLPESQRPRSEDPEFWKVWTGEEERNIDWKEVAAEWQETSSKTSEEYVSSETATINNSINSTDTDPAGDLDDLPW